MDLRMDWSVGDSYQNESQKIRVITESWVQNNMFCPYCGDAYIRPFENNKPVADFYCRKCVEQYELKSKNGTITEKVVDGAYGTMISRIESVHNPNFLFMHYSKADFQVKDLLLVPKHFFSKSMIEQRKPLSSTARRAGWVGCNIDLSSVPKEGRIFIVKNEKIQSVESVLSTIERTKFIAQYQLEKRGWILDILNCISKMENRVFTLEEMYRFEEELALKHPQNKHIKDKIRQQLQLLRDKGLIEFLGRGRYRKL